MIMNIEYREMLELLNLWNRALLRRLAAAKLLNKLIAFYRTRMFVTVFPKASPATGHTPETDESSPHRYTVFTHIRDPI